MAKNQRENDSSLEPSSDEREDSGLQDILLVAAKLKETPDDELDVGSEESGVILFRAGDLAGEEERSDDDDAAFGSFAGGLGAGFGTSMDPLTSPDLTPLGGEGGVKETVAVESPRHAEDPKRNVLTTVAVVLGLAVVAAGAVFLTNNTNNNTAQPQQAEAQLSANVDEAAVGKAEPTPEDPTAASAGAGAVEQPEPEPEPEPEPAEGEGLLEGEDAGALLADGGDPGDPMAVKQDLLSGGKNPVAKAGKWEPGTTKEPKANDDEPVAPKADPEPKPEPKPEPVKKGAASEDEIECLLNPDLAKCGSGGGGSKSKNEEILAPKLPEKLSQTQLKNGFNTVKSKAKSCASKHGAEAGTKVKVHVSIEGATGKVISSEIKDEHAGTELGKCIENAVNEATFEQFKTVSMGADYSYIL